MNKAQIINKGRDDFEVILDVPPEAVTEIGVYIFLLWREFAMGRADLGGRDIKHPTGRYAASIKRISDSQTSVLIYSDLSVAPHSKYISMGHASIDLKKILEHGRAYPMHREARKFTGYSPPVPISSRPESSAWVIPPMLPYSPAKHLADLAAKYWPQQMVG